VENDSALDRERSPDIRLMAVNGSEPVDDFRDVERCCSAIRWRKRACKGAGSRIRTDDLLITNQLLYQLSYAGENAAHINARRGLEQVAKLRSVNAS
jgi:hypothetical protein